MAASPTSRDWVATRLAEYCHFVSVAADFTADPALYCALTGRAKDLYRAGEVFRFSPPQRPLVHVNLRLAPTLGQAELVIAHEVMHLRWPSYGHKQIAFQRAQELLDSIPPPDSEHDSHAIHYQTRSPRGP